jgi:sacsin
LLALAANPGKKINFVQHALQPSLAHQAAPYQLFGCNTSSYYPGTLFRFPLRTQAQADASTISKQVGGQGRLT